MRASVALTHSRALGSHFSPFGNYVRGHSRPLVAVAHRLRSSGLLLQRVALNR